MTMPLSSVLVRALLNPKGPTLAGVDPSAFANTNALDDFGAAVAALGFHLDKRHVEGWRLSEIHTFLEELAVARGEPDGKTHRQDIIALMRILRGIKRSEYEAAVRATERSVSLFGDPNQVRQAVTARLRGREKREGLKVMVGNKEIGLAKTTGQAVDLVVEAAQPILDHIEKEERGGGRKKIVVLLGNGGRIGIGGDFEFLPLDTSVDGLPSLGVTVYLTPTSLRFFVPVEERLRFLALREAVFSGFARGGYKPHLVRMLSGRAVPKLVGRNRLVAENREGHFTFALTTDGRETRFFIKYPDGQRDYATWLRFFLHTLADIFAF